MKTSNHQKNNTRSYLTTWNVQAGIRITEITNGWHFLHASCIRLMHLIRLSLDVQLKVDLPMRLALGLRASGGRRRRRVRVTVHAVVVVVLATLHDGVVMVMIPHMRRLMQLMMIKVGLIHHLIFVLLSIKVISCHRADRAGHSSGCHCAPRILPQRC